jgi:secreted Zn-dependent insulinase-like peptidase
MKEPLFDTLRSKEQLGYNVSANLVTSGGILGVSIKVNSQFANSTFTAKYVHDRMESFIKWFLEDKMKHLTDGEFNDKINTLIKDKQTVDTNLGEEFARNWARIAGKDYIFDLRDEWIKALKQCKKHDVIQSISSTIGNCADRRKLSIQVIGTPSKSAGKNPYRDGNHYSHNNNPLSHSSDTIKLEYVSSQNDSSSTNFISDINGFKNTLTSFPDVPLNI